MDKRIKRYSGRIVSATGLMLVLGALLFYLLAYAATPTTKTYSDSGYTTLYDTFGRGVSTIYSKMQNGLSGKAYYVDYWGPSVAGGTTPNQLNVAQNGGVHTAGTTGTFDVTDSYLAPSNANNGAWQARFYHNPFGGTPSAGNAAYVVIDSPTTAGAATGTVLIKFHLVDRNGATITTNHTADLQARVAYKTSATGTYTNIWRYKALATPTASKNGWNFNLGSGAGLYQYSYYTNSSTEGATGVVASLLLVRVGSNATAFGYAVAESAPAGTADAYSMAGTNTSYTGISRWGYYNIGAVTWGTGQTCNIVPVTSGTYADLTNVTQADSASMTYNYYFDMYDINGAAMTTYAGTWTNNVLGADNYDGSGQANIPNANLIPTYDSVSGHWKVAIALSTPGKFKLQLVANNTNTAAITHIINFGASHNFTVAGDVTPPANLSWGAATATDNSITLNWTPNTTQDQGGAAQTGFTGILIARDTKAIPDSTTTYGLGGPVQGRQYQVAGGGPYDNFFQGGSAVIVAIVAPGATTYTDGSNCNIKITNGVQYHYKAYSFDSYYNYSKGTELYGTTALNNGEPQTNTTITGSTTTPVDNTQIGAVTGTGPGSTPTVIAGNQLATIYWINPNRCDFSKVRIRYSTSTFPTDVTGGTDGSTQAGTDITGGIPGGSSNVTQNGLSNGLPYYYTIWAADDDGIWSVAAHPVSYAVPHDTIPPASISNLDTVPNTLGAFGVTLTWTAVANDGTNQNGSASSYDIRYSNTPVPADANVDGPNAETWWKNAWHTVGQPLPTPSAPGLTDIYEIAGLSPMQPYYFAIKVADASGNWSPISYNAVYSVTNGAPSVTTRCNAEISECNQCHLLPPDDDLPGAHPRGTGNIGYHDMPIGAVAPGSHATNNQIISTCNTCHANGQVWRNNTTLYQFNHQRTDGQIQISTPGYIGYGVFGFNNHSGGTFYAQTTIIYKFKNYSSGIGYKQVTGYCANTYCHGAGTGLSSPLWGIGTETCGEYCHEAPPATGKHVRHYHPGQYYANFGPSGVVLSGYSTYGPYGWTRSDGVTPTTPAAANNTGSGGNNDIRYATYESSADARKVFSLPAGNYYVTVCVGDSMGAIDTNQIAKKQYIAVSGDGGTTWVPLINEWDGSNAKLFKKAVDIPVIVTNNGVSGLSNNLILQMGDGTNITYLNYMIVNSTPEAPKSNNTLRYNTATEYGFGCGKCHVVDTTQAKHTTHVMGPVQKGYRDAEIAFDRNALPRNISGIYNETLYNISSLRDGQGYYYTTGGACQNLYCHGNTLHAGGSNTTPVWHNGYVDEAGSALCGSCHDAGYADTTPLTNITTGSHKKHTNRSYAYRFDCFNCHYNTVNQRDANGKMTIKDRTYHVNGVKDVYFNAFDPRMTFARFSTSQTECYSVYCHSNGLLKNGTPFWGTQYAYPIWGSGSKTCNYCHGTSTATGKPDYANNTATPNSHDMHVLTNGLGCSKCHYNTTRDNGASIYTGIQPALHVNGTRDVTFDAENNTSPYIGTFDPSARTCNGTYCHGQMTNPTWGTSVKCGQCHGASDTDPHPNIGAHSVHNNGNHTSITASSANTSGGANYDFTCRFCHYQTTHGGGEWIAGRDTAEVRFNTVSPVNGYNNSGATFTPGTTVHSDNANWHYTAGTCANLKCHSNGRGGAPKVTNFNWLSPIGSTLNCSGCHGGSRLSTFGPITSYAHVKHVANATYAFPCSDCHNYTADLNNLAPNGRAYHVNGVVDVTVDPALQAPGYSFSGVGTGDSCSNIKCHWNADPSAWGGQVWYIQGINWKTYQTTCTTCHSNSYWPNGDTSPGLGTRNGLQTLSHAHGKHLGNATSATAPGYGSRIGCSNCHRLTASGNTSLMAGAPHNNGTKDIVFFASTTMGTGPRQVFFLNMTGPSTVSQGTGYWGNFNRINSSSANCTVICHSDGKGNAPNRLSNWSTHVGTYLCNSCHGGWTNLSNPIATGSHTKHLNDGYKCNDCHRLTAGANADGTPFINRSGYMSHHVNGSSFTSYSATVNNDVWISPSKFYNGLPATYNRNGVNAGTCSNVSCHGGQTTPVWGVGTTTCTSCHASPPRYSQHFRHFSGVTPTYISEKNQSVAGMYRFGCGKCHSIIPQPVAQQDGLFNITHTAALGKFTTAEVVLDTYSSPQLLTIANYTSGSAKLGRDANGFNYSNGTCRNVYCHSNANPYGGTMIYANPSWGDGHKNCRSCHTYADIKANVTLSAPHGTHVGTDTYNFQCSRCHARTITYPNRSTIADKSRHVNGTKDIYFATLNNFTGSYNSGTHNCQNTYCHSNGDGTQVTVPSWGTSLNCSGCHADRSTINTRDHGFHLRSSIYGPNIMAAIGCKNCHRLTATSDSSVSYTNGKHVNGTKDLYFLKYSSSTLRNITGGYNSANRTCRSNYCHSSGQMSSGSNGTLTNMSTPVFRLMTFTRPLSLGCKACHGGTASLFGEPSYANRSTSGTMKFAWYNGHQAHVRVLGDCQKCHYRTLDANARIIPSTLHLNGQRDVVFAPAYSTAAVYYASNKRCTVPKCHASSATVPIRWGGKLANDCQSCHSDQGAGAYANHSTVATHNKHTNATTYKFACDLCHAGNTRTSTTTNTTHTGGNVSTNQAAEVYFYNNTTSQWQNIQYGVDAPAGTVFRYKQMNYAWGVNLGTLENYSAGSSLLGSDKIGPRNYTAGKCISVWCHSNAYDSAPTYTKPVWGNTLTCTGCHGGRFTLYSTATWHAHRFHLNSSAASYGKIAASISCQNCHVRTTSSETAIIAGTGFGYHVNGVRDVFFQAVSSAAGNFKNITGGYNSTGRTCRNLYCHSSGQARYPANATLANLTTPVLRTPSWTGSVTSKCKACHGVILNGMSSIAGEPDYPNRSTVSRVWFNSHNKHVKNPSFAVLSSATDCYRCHNLTVDAKGKIITGGNHINGAINVSFAGGGNYTNKRCSTTGNGCHDGFSPRWGENICKDCHGVNVATKTDDFRYGNHTTATVSLLTYTSVGHGKTGSYNNYGFTNQSGASSSKISAARRITDCTSCHTTATSHNTAGNPFRLISSNVRAGVYPSQVDTVCGYCHSTGIAEHNLHNTSTVYSGGINPKWLFTPKCVDCHDPHGDVGANGRANAYMMQSYINYTSGSNAYGQPASAYGPYRKQISFPADVTAKTYFTMTSFVTPTFTGLCQVCHTRGADTTGQAWPAHYNRALYGTATMSGNCLGCHTMTTGFKGVGGDCTACHGTGGQATHTSPDNRRNIVVEFANSSSHHVFGTPTKTDCAACHAEGNADGSLSGLHTGVAGHPVYLKNWTGTYTGTNTGFTVLTTSKPSTGYFNTTRLTPFCLGCHKDKNNTKTPFSDGLNPNNYSWDTNSIDSKYSNTGTAQWGKFNSTQYNVVPADTVRKSYSPHGNPSKNQFSMSIASFSLVSTTVSKTKPVACLDCHNAHASNVSGGTSYTSKNAEGGNFNSYSTSGGYLRWRVSTSGAKVRYKPASGGSTTTNNAYSTSASLCFDCHLDGPTGAAKNYTSFGLPKGKTIAGSYYDRVGMTSVWSNWSTTRWASDTPSGGTGGDTWRGSFAFKDAHFKGGHFGNSIGWLQSNKSQMGTVINGNCTACHDPHGVSSDMATTKTSPVRTLKMSTNTNVPTVSGTYTGTNSTGVYVVRVAKTFTNYEVSANGGKTWSASTATGTGVTTGMNGLTITLPTAGGTNYVTDDTWTFLAGNSQTAQYMVPALKGTWMHSPYKEDRAVRNDYTLLVTGNSQTGGTARLSTVTQANDYTSGSAAGGSTTKSLVANGSTRLWDDTRFGNTTSANQTNISSPSYYDYRQVGGPAPRANPDFATGTYVPGFNIPAVQGDGMGVGPANYIPTVGKSFYGYTGARIGSWKGWNGYFIDENTFGLRSAKPALNSGTTYKNMTTANPNALPGNFAGLCLRCHAWDRTGAGIALNNVSSANLTTGTQRITIYPHQAVMGLGGITVNLYRRSTGAGTVSQDMDSYMHEIGYLNNDAANNETGGPQGGGAGTARFGKIDPTSNNGNGSSTLPQIGQNNHYYRWGVTAGNATHTTQATYHRFPCSKCHTPHVSKLPRLMKTNCLDTDNKNKAGQRSTSAAPGSSTSNSHTTMAFANVSGFVSSDSTGANLLGSLYKGMTCHSTKINAITGGSGGLLNGYAPGGWNNKTPW